LKIILDIPALEKVTSMDISGFDIRWVIVRSLPCHLKKSEPQDLFYFRNERRRSFRQCKIIILPMNSKEEVPDISSHEEERGLFPLGEDGEPGEDGVLRMACSIWFNSILLPFD